MFDVVSSLSFSSAVECHGREISRREERSEGKEITHSTNSSNDSTMRYTRQQQQRDRHTTPDEGGHTRERRRDTEGDRQDRTSPNAQSQISAVCRALCSAPSSSSSTPPVPVYGCVELGGTTIKVAYALGTPTNVIEQTSFDTGDQPAKAIQTAVN